MARAFTYSATLPHLFNRRRLLEKNYIIAYFIGFFYAHAYPIEFFNLKNYSYIINQRTSHFYSNLNGSYGRIRECTGFPIKLGVNRLKMQLLITSLQCTLGSLKFN